jgi:hypothetical protein
LASVDFIAIMSNNSPRQHAVDDKTLPATPLVLKRSRWQVITAGVLLVIWIAFLLYLAMNS